MNTNVDVYIKDEGYADIKFLTEKAKETANKMGIPNQLLSIGKTFCGQPVWTPETKKGVYSCGLKLTHLKKAVRDLKKNGLTVECEFGLQYL